LIFGKRAVESPDLIAAWIAQEGHNRQRASARPLLETYQLNHLSSV
jgi:hypothetical protein